MNIAKMRLEQGLCPNCGVVKENGKYYCPDCARMVAERQRTAKHKTKYKNQTLDEICIKARAAGMSYGKYLARYGNE